MLKEMDYRELLKVDCFIEKDFVHWVNECSGNNLRNLLMEAELKQPYVASSLGIATDTLKGILRGAHAIDTAKYLGLLVNMGINPLEVIIGKHYQEFLAMCPRRNKYGEAAEPNESMILAAFDNAIVDLMRVEKDKRYVLAGIIAERMFSAKDFDGSVIKQI